MKAMIFALLAAVTIQPFIFFMWFFLPELSVIKLHEIIFASVFVVIFATGLSIILGIPSFLLLRRSDQLSWKSSAITGFLISVCPLAIFNWPDFDDSYSSSANWHGHYVNFVVHGKTTIYGWLGYIESLIIFGLHGLIGALVFFFVWKKLQQRNTSIDVKRTQ